MPSQLSQQTVFVAHHLFICKSYQSFDFSFLHKIGSSRRVFLNLYRVAVITAVYLNYYSVIRKPEIHYCKSFTTHERTLKYKVDIVSL